MLFAHAVVTDACVRGGACGWQVADLVEYYRTFLHRVSLASYWRSDHRTRVRSGGVEQPACVTVDLFSHDLFSHVPHPHMCSQFDKMAAALKVHASALPLLRCDVDAFVVDVVAFVRASWVPC